MPSVPLGEVVLYADLPYFRAGHLRILEAYKKRQSKCVDRVYYVWNAEGFLSHLPRILLLSRGKAIGTDEVYTERGSAAQRVRSGLLSDGAADCYDAT